MAGVVAMRRRFGCCLDRTQRYELAWIFAFVVCPRCGMGYERAEGTRCQKTLWSRDGAVVKVVDGRVTVAQQMRG